MKFIDYVIQKMEKDTAFRAALKKADNPDTEYMSFEYLIPWSSGSDRNLKVFSTVAAAMARSKVGSDGTLSISSAIAKCYEEGNQAEPAKSRFRRLLACSSSEEVCVIIRPILSFISSKGVKISYEKLLNDLLYFSDRVKKDWAKDFYPKKGEKI
jgi:CRISPR system Cascade subunit CasB